MKIFVSNIRIKPLNIQLGYPPSIFFVFVTDQHKMQCSFKNIFTTNNLYKWLRSKLTLCHLVCLPKVNPLIISSKKNSLSLPLAFPWWTDRWPQAPFYLPHIFLCPIFRKLAECRVSFSREHTIKTIEPRESTDSAYSAKYRVSQKSWTLQNMHKKVAKNDILNIKIKQHNVGWPWEHRDCGSASKS